MSEEQQTTQATTQEQTTPTTPPAESTPVATAPAPDWREALDSVPLEELVKHRKFAGALGDRLERERQRIAQEAAADATRRAEEERDQDLAKLLDENDETLSERYPKAKEALIERRKRREEMDLQRRVGESMREFSLRVGQAYAELPEWEEVLREHRTELEEAINSKTNDAEQIQAFTIAAAKAVAKVQTKRTVASTLAEEVEKAKVAIRNELANAQMQQTPAPDLRRPGSGLAAGASRIQQMSDEEFAEYWRNHRAGGT